MALLPTMFAVIVPASATPCVDALVAIVSAPALLCVDALAVIVLASPPLSVDTTIPDVNATCGTASASQRAHSRPTARADVRAVDG
eukprot:980331-Rhodomonas_salina.1